MNNRLKKLLEDFNIIKDKFNNYTEIDNYLDSILNKYNFKELLIFNLYILDNDVSISDDNYFRYIMRYEKFKKYHEIISLSLIKYDNGSSDFYFFVSGDIDDYVSYYDSIDLNIYLNKYCKKYLRLNKLNLLLN